MREMLDAAQAAWPEITNRKSLLLRLADTGAHTLEQRVEEERARARSRSQLEALSRASELIDVDALLGDAAWN